MSLLADPEGNFSISNVIEKNDAFSPALGFELSVDTDVYWLKLKAKEEYVGEEFVLPIRHADSIIVFSQLENGEFIKGISGENIPLKNRMVPMGPAPYISFIVPKQGLIYIKLVSVSPYSIDFREYSSVELEYAESFFERIEKVRYFHGIFLGVLLAVILYNLLIYVLNKDFVYLVYIIYMIIETIYQLSITGFLHEFILVDSPITAKYAPFFIAGISMVSYIWFSIVYLEARKYAPKMLLVLKTIIGVVVFVTIVVFFVQTKLANSVLLICGLLTVFSSFIIAVIAFRKGHRPAKFFLIACSLSYLGSILFVLSSLDLLPLVFVTRYSFQLLFALQALLFAMGLGDRLSRNKKEIASSKLRQVELEKEKETALKNILEKQNEVLEKKVTERTSEILEKTKIIEKDREIILTERKRSDLLLKNILPDSIALRLKDGEDMIADQFKDVSIFFSDIVGFTSLSKALRPNDLVALLNELFSEFDLLAKKYGLEKIKTIGDAYMCVAGLPDPMEGHAVKMAAFALEIIDKIEKINKKNKSELAVRIGVHCGPVIAGVIGSSKFSYDLWGETVNIASRIESHGEAMKVNCSQEFKDAIGNNFSFTDLGEIELKGLGKRLAYTVNA